MGTENVLGKPLICEGRVARLARVTQDDMEKIRVGSNPTLRTMLFVQSMSKPDGREEKN